MIEFTSEQLFQDRGRWRGQLQYKDPKTGKWTKRTHMLKATGKRAAERELKEWRSELEAQLEAEEEERTTGIKHGETVGEYLDEYVEGKRGTVEASTLSEYHRLAYTCIDPYIGDVALVDLNPGQVQSWVNTLNDRYAVSTVRKAYTLLRSAMTRAVEHDRIPKTPVRSIDVPRARAAKPNALDDEGQRLVLTVLEARLEKGGDAPASLGMLIAFYTGMREGEICALRWSSIDLDDGSITITEAIGNDKDTYTYYLKAPKTEGSERKIYIHGDVIRALRTRRAWMMEECMRAGVPFKNSLFVLGGVDGSFMQPQYLSKKWRDMASALELVGTEGRQPTFHDLRHTYATNAIALGADVKTVSNSMGHSDASITLNTYTTVDDGAARRVARELGDAYADKVDARGDVIEFRKTGTGE